MKCKTAFVDNINKFLNIKKNGIYVDCTFGEGGHSINILNSLGANGKLFSFDYDLDSCCFGKNIKDRRLNIINDNFLNIKKYIVNECLLGKVNGVVFDLGISYCQLYSPDRGFSFLRNGPLDMRINKNIGRSAADWINKASKNEILYVIRKFGEEYRYSFKIVNKIIERRFFCPIKTTFDLSNLIDAVIKKKNNYKYKARIFQAIRIFINDELNVLLKSLNYAYDVLSNQGRLVVISFHSLEDRIVKKFIRNKSSISSFLTSIPLTDIQINKLNPIKMINLGKFKPSYKEINNNNNIRSAILRVAEKI